jgi:hypothetical protein
MSKIKIENTLDSLSDRIKDVASDAAIIAMAAATIIGMTELTTHPDSKVLSQPAYAIAGDNVYQPVQDNNIRKEEVAHRPTSYSTAMRSEAISGKR